MKSLIITRGLSTPFGTFSDAADPDGGFACKILERPAACDVANHPRIELPLPGEAITKWTVGVHPLHPEVYEVMNVPGRTAILIHSANVFEQLLGCLAPGATVEPVSLTWEGQAINHVGVTSSKATLAALIAHYNKQPFRLIIKEA